ncbi:DUF805 domain-containing protein [Kribbella sandramycini]|uniref:DUF805 domain-containing protein n=1 Tax=Kribbella sandramycini TaxID=60450 RepID=A0A7Y4P407_9ACTN|nr:DUF805 domain-containing protein [Kribbella sandramycini]MBB6568865.1 uncharacterized membrane protein YhaH (DUF805 family) [Kribbella sandramycini]NOL45633.1 DUF805 domain-containing protein [Kribbella sandramycini]
MQWFIDVITKRYAQFSGRARRKEFWFFQLFFFIGALVLSILDSLLGLEFYKSATYGSFGYLAVVFQLALLVPSIAVSVRRLHDVGRSGWWVLLSFVVCIGWIVLLVWYVREGQVGDNEHGPDPKAAERGQGFGGPSGPAEPGYPTV